MNRDLSGAHSLEGTSRTGGDFLETREVEKLHAHFGKFSQLLHRTALVSQASPFLENIDLKRVLELTWDARQLESHLERLRQIRVAENMFQCPILGVLGQLNAGKSTVVASFLGQESRVRVPRGVTSARGTHRFVYWVPQSWLDDEQKKSLLYELLQSVHQGRPIEHLPQDSRRAEEAYRKGEYDPEAFFTPLVAGDKGLDELQLALLDCPDVESAPAGAAWKKEARQRWEFVVQASQLCSTILLVADFTKLRAQNLGNFLQEVHRRTRPVPLYLLVNKVHPNVSPAELASDHYLRQAASCTCGIYVAFDFHLPEWRNQIPQAIANEQKRWLPPYLEELWAKLKNWWLQKGDSEAIPIFFSLPPEEELRSSNWKELTPCERLLALPQRLEPGRRQQEKLNQWQTELLEQISQAEQTTRRWQEEQAETAGQLQRKLWEFCIGMFVTWDAQAEQKVVRAPVRPELIEAFNEALSETAPKYMFLTSFFQIFRRGFGKLWKGMKTIVEIARGVEKIKENYRRDKPSSDRLTGFSPDDLAQQMCDRKWVPPDIPEEKVKQAWQSILKKLDEAQKDFPLDKEKLKSLAQKQWDSMSGLKKAILALSGVAAPVLVVFALVDGGASLLAWLGLVKAASVASAIPGGVLALVSLVPGTLGTLFVPLMRDAVLFLSALYHLACDEFGLPRVEGNSCREFFVQAGSETLYLVESELLNLDPPQEAPTVWLHPTAGIYQLDDTLTEIFKENRQFQESILS